MILQYYLVYNTSDIKYKRSIDIGYLFSFRSTSSVEDIFCKLEGWNRFDVQQVQLEHSKDHALRKLLLRSENSVKLKEKVHSIE